MTFSEAEQLFSTKKTGADFCCFLLGNSITRRIKRCEKTSLTKKSCVFSRSRNSPAPPFLFSSPPSLTATMFAQTDLFLLSQYYNTSFPAQPHFFSWPNSIVHFPPLIRPREKKISREQTWNIKNNPPHNWEKKINFPLFNFNQSGEDDPSTDGGGVGDLLVSREGDGDSNDGGGGGGNGSALSRVPAGDIDPETMEKLRRQEREEREEIEKELRSSGIIMQGIKDAAAASAAAAAAAAAAARNNNNDGGDDGEDNSGSELLLRRRRSTSPPGQPPVFPAVTSAAVTAGLLSGLQGGPLAAAAAAAAAAASGKDPPSLPMGLAGLEAFRREYLTSPLSHLRNVTGGGGGPGSAGPPAFPPGFPPLLPPGAASSAMASIAESSFGKLHPPGALGSHPPLPPLPHPPHPPPSAASSGSGGSATPPAAGGGGGADHPHPIPHHPLPTPRSSASSHRSPSHRQDLYFPTSLVKNIKHISISKQVPLFRVYLTAELELRGAVQTGEKEDNFTQDIGLPRYNLNFFLKTLLSSLFPPFFLRAIWAFTASWKRGRTYWHSS